MTAIKRGFARLADDIAHGTPHEREVQEAMRYACSYCHHSITANGDQGDKLTQHEMTMFGEAGGSHGICNQCKEAQRAEIAKWRPR